MPTLRILEANTLIENAKKMSKAVQDELASILLEGMNLVAREAESLAPVFSGNLRSTIKSYRIPAKLIARAQVYAPYALAVEMGYKGVRGRGNRGNKPPMSPAFVEWAKAHGLNPFALSRSIWKKGYDKQPFLLAALVAQKEAVLQKMMNLLPDAAARAGIPQTLAKISAAKGTGE